MWDSWLVLVDGALSSSPLDQLLALAGEHPARTGAALVMVADTKPVRGLGVRLTGQGRVLIPSLGLDLIANGLTPPKPRVAPCSWATPTCSTHRDAQRGRRRLAGVLRRRRSDP